MLSVLPTFRSAYGPHHFRNFFDQNCAAAANHSQRIQKQNKPPQAILCLEQAGNQHSPHSPQLVLVHDKHRRKASVPRPTLEDEPPKGFGFRRGEDLRQRKHQLTRRRSF